MNLCTPALVYLVISIVSLLLNFSLSVKSALIQMVFVGLWTFILNFICSKGLEWLSWGLVLLPYILIVFFALFAYDIVILETMKNKI